MTSAKNAFALVETDMIASRESAQNVELSNILSSVRAVIVSAKIVTKAKSFANQQTDALVSSFGVMV